MAQPGSRRRTINWICSLPAWPAPTTDFLIKLAEYSATGTPRSAGANSTTPRATPSFSVEAAFLLTKLSSTAASSGRKRSSTTVSWRNKATSRSASGRSVGAWTTPSATWLSRLPAASITPQPVCRSPGSSPRTRIAVVAPHPLGSSAQPRQYVLADLEIGVNILHVVAVLESFEQLEQADGGLLVYHRGGFRPPAKARRTRGAESLFQRVAHAVEILRRRDHDVAVILAFHITGAGLDRGVEHRIGARRGGRIGDLADMIEQETDTARLAERAAGLGEGGA